MKKLKLRIRNSSIVIKGASGKASNIKGICKVNIKIQEYVIENIEMIVVKSSIFGRNSICEGIIGTDILFKFDFRYSLKDKRMDFISLSNTNTNMEEIIPIFTVDRDIVFYAIIDTGAKESWLTEDSKLCIDMKYKRKFLIVKSINGISIKRSRVYNLISLIIRESYSVELNNIYVGRSVVRNNKIIDIVLGLDFMEKFILIKKDGRLILERYIKKDVY